MSYLFRNLNIYFMLISRRKTGLMKNLMQKIKILANTKINIKFSKSLIVSYIQYSLADFEDNLLQEIRELLNDRYRLPASKADAVHRGRGVVPCFAESSGRTATFLRGNRTAWKPNDDYFVAI